MKLLDSSFSQNDANGISGFLRQHGILTFISSKDSHRMGSFLTAATTVGVWVVLDEQYNDALNLLKNPEHEVSNPLSMEEMQIIESQTNQQSNWSLDWYRMALL